MGRTVSPRRFEASLRTFLFLSELLVDETPESTRDRIPLYEDEDQLLSTLPSPVAEDDDEEQEQENDNEPLPIELK